MSSTRQQILDAALDLFSKQGFHGTSIRQIAEEVGIRKSSIYNHFQGKKDILEQLFNSFGGATVKEKLTSDKLKEKVNQPYQFLKTLVREVISELNDEREQKFVRLLLSEHTTEVVNKREGQLIEDNLELLGNIFSDMMEKGLIREQDPIMLAHEFVGPLILLRLEYLQLEIEKGGVEKLRTLAEQHVGFFWDAIKKGGG